MLINHLLHELTADTPDGTINNIISVFCGCLTEAISYKLDIEALGAQEAKDFIRMAIGASIKSHEIAREELMELQ